MTPKVRTVERELAQLGTAAHGVVTRLELLGAGVTNDEIRQRLRNGSLIREFKGVYRVGHRAPNIEAQYLAAVRACGGSALLYRRAASHLLGLTKGIAPAPEVIAPGEHRVPGLVTCRCRRLDARDATMFHDVPVTTVPRTLVDLAAILSAGQLARACHEAEVLWRVTPPIVEAVLARRPSSRGATKLRMVLRGGVPVTLSELERAFLRLLRRAGLPLPEMNKVAGGRRVDCRWPGFHLTVELDGYRYHNTRYAWEQDRRREREARARGDEFRRYTYGDIVEDPRYVLAELRALLARRPG